AAVVPHSRRSTRSVVRSSGPVGSAPLTLSCGRQSLLGLTAAAPAAPALAAVGRHAWIGRGALRALSGATPAKLRFRQLVEVIRPVADRLALRVKELQRLLEDDWRGRILRDRRVKDVQLV